MQVDVMVPEEYMGDVIGDLNSRRGQIQGMEPRGAVQAISRKGSAVRDVRLRYRSALPFSGSWSVCYAAEPLC